MRIDAVAGTASSPMRMPVFDSMNFRFDNSCCDASKSFLASSETNFTLRSAATSNDGTPATTSRLTTEVIASEADRSEEHTSELQSHSFISYAVFCLKK